MFLMPIRYCKPHDNIIFKVNALQWFCRAWLRCVIQGFMFGNDSAGFAAR